MLSRSCFGAILVVGFIVPFTGCSNTEVGSIQITPGIAGSNGKPEGAIYRHRTIGHEESSRQFSGCIKPGDLDIEHL